MSHAIYRLLATCARAECDASHYRRIIDVAGQVTVWDTLPACAQAHGLAPLANAHLRAANIAFPRTIKRDLNALATRSRLASQTDMRVLGEILRQYQAEGIQVLVLKGAALDRILYPEPGLRPMRDLDLLVRRADLKRAQQLLGAMGFDAPMTFSGHHGEHRHLSPAAISRDGYSIGVELHHNLFEPGASPILAGIQDLTSPPISFSLEAGGLVGWTLGYEDMLWHLCQHIVESTNIFSSVCLIWVADIVSFAERFCAQIDWERIQRRYPTVLSTLGLLHFLTPLSSDLIRQANVILGREPAGMWGDFQKPPRIAAEEQLSHGYSQTLRRAMTPSDWWLRLHYGLGSAQPLRWHHRLSHVTYLVYRFSRIQTRHSRLNEIQTTLE